MFYKLFCISKLFRVGNVKTFEYEMKSDYACLMDNTIIYLLGHEGVGKYTIAKELVKLTGAKLVDNHATNNLIFSLIDTDGKNDLPDVVWHRVRQVRAAVFETIATLSPPEYSFVFSNALKEDRAKDKVVFNQILEIARVRSSRLAIIRLSCSTSEITKRIVNADRTERFKSIDANAAKERNETQSVLKPEHPNVLELDTTSLSAAEAAKKILAYAKQVN